MSTKVNTVRASNPAEKKALVSPAYKLKADAEDKLKKVYTPEELLVYTELIDRLEKARIQREQPHEEFDDLTYEQDYIQNRRAANSYLRRKKNKREVRVNTGTTEKKVETVFNELFSMNIQPEVAAYDDDDTELTDLGDNFTDIVKRTNEIEKDDDFWVLGLWELLTQRALFVEERYIDKQVRDRKKSGSITDVRIQRCEKRVLSGLQVYLGDVTIPSYLFDTQPYIVKYERMSYAQGKTLFEGKYDNWQYVQKGTTANAEVGIDYRFNKNIEEDEIEVVHYMSFQDDEYQIIVNGVMMLPIGSELPWEHEGYNIKMITLKPMGISFAYGKCLVASAKTLQALDNETIRLLIRKFRQGVEPPTGTRKGKILPKNIWDPGRNTQGLRERDFTKLIDHDGVTSSEYQMREMINKLIEEFVGSGSLSQGLEPGGNPTATEIVTLQKQAIKMLGLAVYAWVRARKELTYLRIYNVLENYTDPYKYAYDDVRDEVVEVYRKFTVNDGTLENGKKGKKAIQFMGRDLERGEEEFIKQKEDESDKAGKSIRYKTVNAKKLRSIRTIWFVTATPQPAESSELKQAMFTDQLRQAAGIVRLTGTPLNGGEVVEQFERKWKAKDFFQKGGQPGQGQEQGGEDNKEQMQNVLNGLGELEKTDISGDLGAGLGQPQRPSANSVANQ